MVAVLVASWQAAPAHADDAPLDLNRFRPALGADKILTTDLAAVGPDWQLVPQLFLHYADRPLVLTLDGEFEQPVIQNRITGDLGIALSLAGRLQLGVSFPVTLTQSGEPLDLMPLEVDGMPVNPPSDVSGTGLEDLRVSLKGVIWQRGPYGVGALARVSVPTGDGDSYLGSASPTFDARVMGHMRRGRLTAGVALGWLFASTEQVLLTRTGNALTFSMGAEYRVFERDTTTVSVAAEFFGLAHSRFETSDESPLELLLAGKAARDDWTFFVGAGPGLTPGYGEPRVRVLAGVSYAYTPPKRPPRPPEPVVVEPPPPPPPPPEPPSDEPVWVNSTITLPTGLLFEYDRCAILPKSYDELRKLAKNLAARPEWGDIRVDGHASKEGEESDDDYNLRLSRCRAQRIAEFLSHHGVARERLSYLGFGFRCPLVDNDTEEGRVQNRRVDFVRNPEKNPPSCEVPPQLEPLPKHVNEPRPYLEKGGAAPRKPVTPPAGTSPAGTSPAKPATGTPPATPPAKPATGTPRGATEPATPTAPTKPENSR